MHDADDHGKVMTVTTRDPQEENGRLDPYMENEKKIAALKKEKKKQEKNKREELRKDLENMAALSSKAPIGAWIRRLKTKFGNIFGMFFKKSVRLLVGC